MKGHKSRKQTRYRSSRLEMFCKKGVLRHFTKFKGKDSGTDVFIKTLDDMLS